MSLARYDLVKTEKGVWELKTDGNVVARAETKAEIVDDLKGTVRL